MIGVLRLLSIVMCLFLLIIPGRYFSEWSRGAVIAYYLYVSVYLGFSIRPLNRVRGSKKNTILVSAALSVPLASILYEVIRSSFSPRDIYDILQALLFVFISAALPLAILLENRKVTKGKAVMNPRANQ